MNFTSDFQYDSMFKLCLNKCNSKSVNNPGGRRREKKLKPKANPPFRGI